MPRSIDEEKALARRLVISHFDLRECYEYLNLIRDDYDPAEEDPSQKAATIAAVVSYWRPFSRNWGEGETRSSLPSELLDELTDSEKELHEEVGRLRNKVFAHSDPSEHSLNIAVSETELGKMMLPSSRDPIRVLTEVERDRLKEIVEKLLRAMSEERSRIRDKLPYGARF